MRKSVLIVPLVLAFVCTAPLVAQGGADRSLYSPDGVLRGDDSRLKATVVTGRLDQPIVPGSSILWSASPTVSLRIDFPVGFETVESAVVSVAGRPVRCFGIPERSTFTEALSKQVTCLYWGGVGPGEEGFFQYVLELQTKSPDDRLLLARVVPEKTLAETIAAVQRRIAEHEVPEQLNGVELIVPCINLDLLCRFLRPQPTPTEQKPPASVAPGRIRFQLDGGKPDLDQAPRTDEGGSGPFILNRSFLVLLERKFDHSPTFVLWIDNSELLVPETSANAGLARRLRFQVVQPFSEGLAAVRINDKWGYIDASGRMVIKPEYAYAKGFHEGRARVVVDSAPGKGPVKGEIWGGWEPERQPGLMNGNARFKWTLIDRTGRRITPTAFDRASDFEGGVAIVSQTGGFVSGGTSATCPNLVWGPAEEGCQWYLIDSTGRRITPDTYDGINSWDNGMMEVERADLYGLVSRAGKTVVQPRFDWIESLDQGVAAVRLGDKWGFINPDGKLVIPCLFDDLVISRTIDSMEGFTPGKCFYEGLATVSVNGQYGFIDKTGKFIIPPLFQDAGVFNQGLVNVKVGTKWGFIDRTGRVVIEPQFDRVCEDVAPGWEGREAVFYEGLASVAIDDKWGVIDKTGNFILPPMFDWISPFQDGIAKVFLGGNLYTVHPPVGVTQGIIDRHGRILVWPRYQFSRLFGKNAAFVLVGAKWHKDYWQLIAGKWGIVDLDGNFLVPPTYDDVGTIEGDTAWVCTGVRDEGGFLREQKWQCIDHTGKEVEEENSAAPEGETTKLAFHWPLSNGMTMLVVGDLYGLLDKTGKLLVKPKFEDEFAFVDGLAKVKFGGRYGFIDTTGRPVVKPRFIEAGDFVNGFAPVALDIGPDKKDLFDTRWGFIDKIGRVLDSSER